MKRSLPRDTRDCLVCLNPAELCAHHAGAPAVKLRAKNAALRAEVRRLRRLEPHARHSPSCAWFRESGTFTCDCGFAAALAPSARRRPDDDQATFEYLCVKCGDRFPF